MVTDINSVQVHREVNVVPHIVVILHMMIKSLRRRGTCHQYELQVEIGTPTIHSMLCQSHNFMLTYKTYLGLSFKLMAGKIAYKTQCLLVQLYMALQQEREDRVKRR